MFIFLSNTLLLMGALVCRCSYVDRQLTKEVAVQVFVTCVPALDIHYRLTSDRDDMYVIFPGDRNLMGILDIHSWTQRSMCIGN